MGTEDSPGQAANGFSSTSSRQSVSFDASTTPPAGSNATPTSAGRREDELGLWPGARDVHLVEASRARERIDDVERARRVERQALRPAESVGDDVDEPIGRDAVDRVVRGERRRRHVQACRPARTPGETPRRSPAATRTSRPSGLGARAGSIPIDRRRTACRPRPTPARSARPVRRRRSRRCRRGRCDTHARRSGSRRTAHRPVPRPAPSGWRSRPATARARPRGSTRNSGRGTFVSRPPLCVA